MSYELILETLAEKKLTKLPAALVKRIDDKLERLAFEPRPPGVRKLVGQEGLGYRVRVGDYRILYAVDDSARTVTVYDIDKGEKIY